LLFQPIDGPASLFASNLYERGWERTKEAIYPNDHAEFVFFVVAGYFGAEEVEVAAVDETDEL
jgi:hypothetical protein